MNQRQLKKIRKKILLLALAQSVSALDEKEHKYNARALAIPSKELKTLTHIGSYRIEIRSSREEKHNYAHFHVVKGNEGMASIRIDDLTVIDSTLPKKDLNKILLWAHANRDLLVEVWNEFHGHRILVE